MNLHVYEFHVRAEKFWWNGTRKLILIEMAASNNNKKIIDINYNTQCLKKTKIEK
jgi:hypothetical protein